MQFRSLLNPFVRIEPLWRLLDATVLRPGRTLDQMRRDFILSRRQDAAHAETIRALATISPDLTVQHGLLAGLKFPYLKATYGALGAKLLGSYEQELHPTIASLCAQQAYSLLVDVGSAEGYYAIGLARLMPRVKVRAFDTDPDAVAFCREMAIANGVGDRVTVSGFCDFQTLMAAVDSEKRALIISDCEGYETHLFPLGSGEALRAHDLIIEAHDYLDITVSSHLQAVFGSTHNVEIVRSLDDLDKVRTYHNIFPELVQFGLQIRRLLVSEGRRAIQQWFVMRSRV